MDTATRTSFIPVEATPIPTRMVFGEPDDAIREALLVRQSSGYFEVICHGAHWPNKLAPYVAGKQILCDPVVLALCIQAHPGFTGQPVRLIVCYAGAFSDGVAQQLADLLQVPVVAPSGMIAGDENEDRFTLFGGQWRGFTPASRTTYAVD